MARVCHAGLESCVPAVILALLSGCGSPERRTERLLREAATADPRPVEARLSSSRRYSPWDGLSVSPRSVAEALPEGEDQPVLRGSRPVAGRDPEELHRIGLLELHRGSVARAVSALEAAADRSSSAVVLSDLAAAYLALAEDDRPWLVVDAVVAATRAVALAPEEPGSAFNLALALEQMSLAEEAGRAWERYLALESDGAWRQEASEHLARLHEPTTAERWKADKDRLVAAAVAGDRATVARLAGEYRRQSKELLESELLPAWADAVGTPAEAARLAVARLVAEALAGTGERFYIDAIAAIEKRTDASRALAIGHRAYALALATRGNCSEAEPVFERAVDRLTVGESPMAFAARFGQLVCLYRRRPAEAEEQLAELASQLDGRGYPTLLARTEGMRGLSAMIDGRHSVALPHYERAVQLLVEIGDSDVVRFNGMLDEAYSVLGDREGVWRYRLPTLRGATTAGIRQIRHGVLVNLALNLIGSGRHETARAVVAEMLANARGWHQPGAEAEALLRRIDLGLLNGAAEQVAADIAACRQALEQYEQPAARARVETELTIASAEQRLATNPAEALKLIRTAMPWLEASGDGLLLPRALLDLARAELAAGDLEAAEKAFERGLQVFEDRRAETVSEEHRISFFSTAQRSFDAMIRFQALERGDARAAFPYAERVRASELRDRLQHQGEASEVLSLDEQLERIPANVAVFAYTVLPENLLLWQLRQGGLRMHVLPVTRDKVAGVVGSLRAALSGARSPDAGKTAAARAFDLLLRPMLQDLPADAELVFVPDRELHQVPFAALFDAQRGRYLIEDHACLVTPSLELYLASLKRRAPAAGEWRRVLAVGDPAFDSERFPALPRLRHAREEAMAVAALYEDARALVGEEATRQRILDELPGSDLLHLAAHVVVDPRDLLGSWVATADPGREPLRASDLDAERLAGVELVFLAACDTAPGFADGDREGVAGLARAFLAAGVPSVVATLWAVNDEAAARLATVFHSRLLEGESPAQALRLAQLDLISEPVANDPFAWVPFQLYRGR